MCMSVCYLRCLTAFVMCWVNLKRILKVDIKLWKLEHVRYYVSSLCQFFSRVKEHLTKHRKWFFMACILMKVLSLNHHKGIPVHSILLVVSTIFLYILLDDHFNVIQRDMKNWDLSFDFKSPTISSIVSFQRMLKANTNTTPISGLCSLFVLKSPHDFYHHFLLWCAVSLQLLVISLRYNGKLH